MDSSVHKTFFQIFCHLFGFPISSANEWLVVWPLYFYFRSFLRSVNCETFSPVLWMFLEMPLFFWFLFFSHSSHIFYVFNCSCFHWRTCSIYVAQDNISFFLFQDISNTCLGYGQCLSNVSDRFSFISQLQNRFLFSYRWLSLGSSFLTGITVFTDET